MYKKIKIEFKLFKKKKYYINKKDANFCKDTYWKNYYS
jgi:hypothetical protein